MTADATTDRSPGIGLLAERSLHAALKQHLARPGDRLEERLGRYVIDIIRDDLLIEIQTRHLYAMRPKLRRLLDDHHVHLIHPLPHERWIVRRDAAGRRISRRKSPKHATVYDLFSELVRIPDLAAHPNLTLEALLVQEEEIWVDDGRGSWRRGRWSRTDRLLLGVVGSVVLQTPADYLALLPGHLAQPFSNKELAAALRCPVSLAQKMTYTLRRMELLEPAGKDGRALVYRVASPVAKS